MLELRAEPMSGLTTATNALRAQYAQADQTAGRIARAGLADASESGPDGLDAGKLAGDLVILGTTGHSIAAATSALRTLDATLGELVHLLDRRA
jgi:orotate phosphoribosyltransferase